MKLDHGLFNLIKASVITAGMFAILDSNHANNVHVFFVSSHAYDVQV